MAKEKIQLNLKGDGLSYTAQIDHDSAARIMAMCLSSEPKASLAHLPSAPQANNHSPSTNESVVEYLNRLAPRRNPDKILTLAGYLKESQQKTSFHPNEIRNLFKDAGEMLPANFTRDLLWAIRSGWIAKGLSKKDGLYVTNTGWKVLQGGFPEDLVKKSKNKSTRKKKLTPDSPPIA